METKIFFKKIEKKFFIYCLAGYSAGYPVSGNIIGRISGQISIRYNPSEIFRSMNVIYLAGDPGGPEHQVPPGARGEEDPQPRH